MLTDEEIRQFLSGLDQEAGLAVKKVQFPEFNSESQTGIKVGLDYVDDVLVDMIAELGDSETTLGDFLRLAPGSIITLNRAAGETVDLMINGVRFAKGEVLVIGDFFALRLHSVIAPRIYQTEGKP